MRRFPLIENMFGLTGLQVINFGLTITILPYLTRALGISAFGEVVFAQLIINYAMWVVNWGFYLGAAQRVAALRDDRVSIERIFAATWFAQFGLTIIVMLGYLACILLLAPFDGLHPLYFSGLVMIVGNTLSPIWFLTGLERIKLAAALQIGNKLLAVPAVIFLVDGPESSWIYLLAMGISMLMTGAISLWTILFHLKFKVSVVTLNDVLGALREDASLFLSSMAANMGTSIVPAALGAFGGSEALGYYNLADRARGAALVVLSPITHALFPRMCYLFSNNRTSALKLLKVSGSALLAITTLLGVLLFGFAEPILRVLGGSGFEPSVAILKLLAFTPILTVLAQFATYQIIIPNHHYDIYAKVTLLALVISVALILPGIHLFGALGGALVTITTETLMMLVLWRYILHQRLLSKRR